MLINLRSITTSISSLDYDRYHVKGYISVCISAAKDGWSSFGRVRPAVGIHRGRSSAEYIPVNEGKNLMFFRLLREKIQENYRAVLTFCPPSCLSGLRYVSQKTGLASWSGGICLPYARWSVLSKTIVDANMGTDGPACAFCFTIEGVAA